MRKLIRVGNVFGLIGFMLLSGCQTVQNTNDKQAANSHHGRATVTKRASHTKVKKNRYVPTEKDSAPKGPVPRSFKEVKPVNAPLSRYGNPATYYVDGHRYNVMTTASGYRTRGLASWYGTKFHSKRTSSGEDYDMYALTAAHKTLPLPTYIRVKNLKNGREAIVKVNDRGPFHSGRILDLSYGAAAKLGIFPQGTALVEIEALTLKGHEAHYYLQAGAFASGQLAEQLRVKLAKISPSPVFIEKDKQRFLVRVGPFANRQMSDQLKIKLAHNGVTGSFSMLM